MAQNYDVVVIGAGPGGYVAALRLAGRKLKVALVERKYLGGTCLNVGCIPTKALLHNSEIAANIAHAAEHGIEVGQYKINLKAMIKRKNDVVKRLSGGVAALLKGRKVDVYYGIGKLSGTDQIEVQLQDGGSETLSAANIIIACGSEPIVPGVFPQDRNKVMTSDEILNLEEMPDSLLIVGGGFIGCEFATIFSELGAKVVLVEMLDRLLPMTDKDISTQLTKTFKAGGIEVYTATAVEKMEVVGDGVSTTLQGGNKIDTTLALVCTGRRPVTEGLGLEKVGVKLEKGFVVIDEQCRTNVPNIYAIGDITGKVQLAHVAGRQAAVAANNIAGVADREDYLVVPSAVYTHPEIASVGLTADEARARGIDIRTATFPMMASGMALAHGQPSGFVKLVADADDVIVGAHLMCPHASDMVQEVAVLMKSECTLHELANTIHGHPTFVEALAEAAEALLGHPLHAG